MKSECVVPSPMKINQIGSGFISAKVMLFACKIDLFTFLSSVGKATAEEIKSHFNWQCSTRNVYDFLDILYSIELLKRDGVLYTSVYYNSSETEYYLDKNKPSYIGQKFIMMHDRNYLHFNNLGEALKYGKSQNERTDEPDMFQALKRDPQKLKEFAYSMSAFQKASFELLVTKFDFSKYNTLSDIGGCSGALCINIAKMHPNIKCTSYDIPEIEIIAQELIANQGLDTKVSTGVIDFLKEDFPKSDVITMGNILHDWDESTKEMLVKKAFDALPEGGVLITIEKIIDEERKHLPGLFASLFMLIETEKGFDYTMSEFTRWAIKAGFKSTEKLELDGITSAALAHK